jgi:polyisoprenoid-binding protein YceI
MPTYDQSQADCFVYAFKEGLLAAVGHDVKLRVGKLEVRADGEQVVATFDPASLTVVTAMRQGAENPGALSDKDKRTIEGYVRDDILHPRRYPKIEFRSREIAAEDDGWDVEGDLTLHGRTRTVKGRVEQRGDRVVGRVRLHQPDFGIEPFKAMLGTLKIQPVVEVELSVPVAALAG